MISFFILTFSALFSLLNPIGAVPAFLSLTANYSDDLKITLAKKTSIYIFFIMLFFFICGQLILNFYGITIDSLRIAGGIIICKSGLGLLKSKNKKEKNLTQTIKLEALQKNDISFTPLAMPLLAGPGTISYLIATSLQEMHIVQYITIFSCILSISILSYLILKLSPKILKYIGHSGISAMANVMGFFVLALGIQSIFTGLQSLLKSIVLL
ncbi:MAG: MarC family protein [Bacteroidetes bacterium]|nr:MarC family protein [Bacteroidota bacterium]